MADIKEKLKEMNIFEKIALVSQKVGAVKKGISVAGQYKALSEADVLKAVNIAESEARLFSYQKDLEITNEIECAKGHFVRVKAVVEIVNLDNPSEKTQFVGSGDGCDILDKAVNKAQTYALKYALLKGYKIIGGDDGEYCSSLSAYSTKELIALIKENVNEDRIKNMLSHFHTDDMEKMTREQIESAVKTFQIA